MGSLVGVLTTDDQFTSATHTYELVSGDGDADNASFSIDGSDLLSSEVFNYELKDTYSIRIRSTSSNGGYTLEKSFDINIVDVADAILDLSLSGNTIQENNSLNAQIGTFLYDVVSFLFTYVFTSGAGDDDNLFWYHWGESSCKCSLWLRNKNTYTIRVKVTNSVGSELEESFSILITDDTSDNCDPDLDFTGDINNFGSLRVNQTDSLNPSETDYKIIALPFDGYFLSNLTSEMRSDQYKIRQWNGSVYAPATGTSSVGKGYMFLSTVRPSDIDATHNECRPSVTVSITNTWAMMGNPYLENIDWSKVENDNGVSGAGLWCIIMVIASSRHYHLLEVHLLALRSYRLIVLL